MKHVLLIEDDRWLAEGLADALVGEKFKLHIVNDPRAALPLFDKLHFDTIVLDMFLPAANGLQMLQELRSHQDTASIPVIICSASAQEFNKKDLEHLGVVSVIDKSKLTPQSLRLNLAKALNNEA